MQRRALLSLVNIAVAVGALLVIFLFPRFAGYAIYAFLGWFVVSFSLVWVARGSSPTVGPAVPRPTTTPSGRPGSPSAGAVRPSPPGRAPEPPAVGFCIYCATDLPPETDQCPACGHARARLS
jgi:hypothetical protein